MANEPNDDKARIEKALADGDGVPVAPTKVRLEILTNIRQEVLDAIHVYRERYRIARILKNANGMTEIEAIVGKNLMALDAIDEEIGKLPK